MKIIPPVLFCLALVAGYFAPDVIHSLSQPSEQVDLSKYCVLSTEPCVQNDVSMLLEHDITRPLVPTTLSVHWPSSEAESLLIELQGVEMDMGIAKYQLKRQENGYYQAQLLLPVCTFDKMTWVGTISDGNSKVFPAIRMER
ncbi:hypothetical protein P7F88_07040 [Vibrio hannami]|uniref:hypothetical protein n=1 Tax=Vibrio hannami TaxID=2717094 RepID=UPI00240F8467|nr:hypothetical protein [Vibrio hannami]MDG3085862.1 hypothetical protein [Vibrio hannami]